MCRDCRYSGDLAQHYKFLIVKSLQEILASVTEPRVINVAIWLIPWLSNCAFIRKADSNICGRSDNLSEIVSRWF